jgi:flagella basal body P-ring formation protein FlgA
MSIFKNVAFALCLAILSIGLTNPAIAAAKKVSVPVLKRAVQSGDIIAVTDLKWASVDVRKANIHAVQSDADIVGMAARRPLMPGRILRQNDFEIPAMVEKGARVTMVLSAGGLRLTALGTALEDGSNGGYIRIKNVETRQTVQGRVLAPNLVEVLPVGQLALR